MSNILNEEFLSEGIILQTPSGFFISKGPFHYSEKPRYPSIYSPLFFNSKNVFISGSGWSFVQKEELLKFLEVYEEKHFLPPWREPSYERFKDLFQKSQSAFQDGALTKVVPVVFAQNWIPLTQRRRAFFIKNIIQQEDGFLYGYWNLKEGMIGCTPEYLFEQNGSSLNTMALAGTSRNKDPHFSSDEKEIQEHQIVVDDILSRWKGFLYKKSERYIKSFSNLQHFQTDIKVFNTQNLNFLQLIQKMHPTSALGGFPPKESFLWLKKHNPERKKHGAPFALCLEKEKSFCLVAIRNIQWKGSSISLGSGCGLTRLSVLDKEWEELGLKRKSVIRLLSGAL